VLLSKDLADWYSEKDSARFAKEVSVVHGKIFVEATEWGELMVLSGAPYLQGIAERFDGDISGTGGDDRCGQSVTYGFSEKIHAQDTEDPPNPYPDSRWTSWYSLDGYTWDKIWTYRRIFGRASGPNVEDVTLQNWGRGNDSPSEYVLLSRKDAAAQVADWKGGIDLEALYDAETTAFGYHYWYKNQTTIAKRITLSKDVWGTCHGLVKIPYMRDTRRSIGLNGWIMNVSMISGLASQVVGEIFADRVALGAYNCDIHGMRICSGKYPDYMGSHPVLPYFVPLRALTNGGIENLLVAGKTIA
jgi:hypothetical protein